MKRSLEHTVRVIRIENRGYDDDDGLLSLPLLSLQDFVSESRRTRVILRKSGTTVVDGEDVVL
ncbi:MAG: hypothetical protein ABIJ47_10340 [Candidatus Bathyarchaeota archaeon]